MFNRKKNKNNPIDKESLEVALENLSQDEAKDLMINGRDQKLIKEFEEWERNNDVNQ